MSTHPHEHSDHDEGRPHAHAHGRSHACPDHARAARGPRIVTVRAVSGLSGDMMLAGLARMLELGQDELDAEMAKLGLDALQGCVRVERKSVNHVSGWQCVVDLPHEHAHRTFADISAIIRASALEERARDLALRAFSLIAEAEGAVHGNSPETVTFHEVGALDSIVDMGLVCSLFARLDPDRFVCSPLPLADGGVRCAHGWLPVPAPAVLQMLEGVPVRGFSGQGETVTPTALALLKALGAEFGPWPDMRVERRALVYGGKLFPDAPNGVIWAFGSGG